MNSPHENFLHTPLFAIRFMQRVLVDLQYEEASNYSIYHNVNFVITLFGCPCIRYPEPLLRSPLFLQASVLDS